MILDLSFKEEIVCTVKSFSKSKINYLPPFPNPSMSKRPYAMTKERFGLVK